ncbi:DUF4349 domain-containing protein [Streptomyces sp. NPDC016562]|uniref:DUF4349 domain-containing protein n=1 Tax=Streptomyces sp. NPDC016562 TaxID=3364966 RepID=UPI0036FC9F81
MRALLGHRSAAALTALSLTGALALTGCGSDADGGRSASGDKAVVAPQEGGAQNGAAPGDAAQGKPGAGAAAPAPADKNGQPPAAVVRPNVIRTATLGIETTDVQKTLAAARTAADGAGGYVGNESTKRGEEGRMTSTLTLRVPADRYDSVLTAMEGNGKLLHRKVDAQDVTEKVADIGSRVASQQASVERVREMMGKASALSEVVMLESELSRRQSDLESLLAQQSALKDRTSMGTITLEVSEPAPKPVAKEEEKEPTFLGALHGGWEVFTTLVRYLVVAVGALLPFALTAALLGLGFRLYRRFRPAAPKAGALPVAGKAPKAAAAPVPAARAARTSDTGEQIQD